MSTKLAALMVVAVALVAVAALSLFSGDSLDEPIPARDLPYDPMARSSGHGANLETVVRPSDSGELDTNGGSLWIRGVLLDELGQGVAGAKVAARQVGQADSRRAESTMDGVFEIEWSDPPGRIAMRVDCEGYEPYCRMLDGPCDGTVFRLRSAPTVRLNVVRGDQQPMYKPTLLHLEWTPVDRGVLDSPFTGVIYGDDVTKHTVRVPETPATIDLRRFGPGVWTIRAESADGCWHGYTSLQVIGGAMVQSASLVLTETMQVTVRGVVLNSTTDTPVPGAYVWPVVKTKGGFSVQEGRLPSEADENGQFEVQVPVTTRMLMCTAVGFGWSVAGIRGKGQVDEVRITLSAERSIIGRVVDAQGVPLAGERVADLASGRTSRVGSDGAFSLLGIPTNRGTNIQVLIETENLASMERHFPADEGDLELQLDRSKWVWFAIRLDEAHYNRPFELELRRKGAIGDVETTTYRCQRSPARIPVTDLGEYRALLRLPISSDQSPQRFEVEGMSIAEDSKSFDLIMPDAAVGIALESDMEPCGKAVMFELLARGTARRTPRGEGTRGLRVSAVSGEVHGRLTIGGTTDISFLWPGQYKVVFGGAGRGSDVIEVLDGGGAQSLKYRLLESGVVERIE